MKYRIEHENGQFWNGKCWGVRQAMREYSSIRSLPPVLPESNSSVGDILLVILSEANPLDVIYYGANDATVARVELT